MPDPFATDPRLLKVVEDLVVRALDPAAPGRGRTDYPTDVPADIPKAYAMVFKAAALDGGATPGLEGLGETSLAWLLAHSDENGDGVTGWGLPFEWDAGGDGTPNPANTEYAITSAIVVDALLDRANVLSGPDRTALLDLSWRALSPFFDPAIATPGGLPPYSLTPQDRQWDVYNTAAYLAGMAQRLSNAGIAAERATALRGFADATMQVLLDRHLESAGGAWYWPYLTPGTSVNDLPHEAYIVYGIESYARESGRLAAAFPTAALWDHFREFLGSAPGSIRAYPDFIAVDVPARSYDVGFALLTLAQSANAPAEVVERLVSVLSTYRLANGEYAKHPVTGTAAVSPALVVNEYETYLLIGSAATLATAERLQYVQGKDVALRGTAQADALTGNAGNNGLTGLAGADVLAGMAGDDVLTGGSGAVSFNANGSRARLVDLDGDGKVDIAQTEVSGRIRGWLSSGTGFGNQTIWGSGSRVQDQMADLSGDRKIDVVQLHENGNIYVWRSNGSGFDAYDVWGQGSRPADKLADFSGDGKADLVQLHENGNIYVWTSNGTVLDDYTVWGRGARPADQVADFNGDGRADVVQLHENGNMYVWTSSGAGFNAYEVWGRGSRPTDLIADLNGDGRADVVQLHENGNIYVWTSNGTGFNDYTVWGRGSRPTDQLADVNGDGRADVVQLHENGNIYVWTSNGTGFNDYTVWGLGARPTDQLADVNGDGRADVVELHENGNAYVWLSTGTSFADYTVRGTGAPDGGGNDTYVFGPGFGRDTIRDFDGGLGAGDVIKFDPAVFGSFAAVMSKTADDGLGNTLITYDSANTLLLEHVRKAQLAADDFLFG